MDEDISAPPSIKLNINEESNIDYYPPLEGIESKTKDEKYTLDNNNEEYKEKYNKEYYNKEYKEKENNNYYNKEEYVEKGIEEEKAQIQRPLNKEYNYEIGTARFVFQLIGVALVYGLAIGELIINIIDVMGYGIIDVVILIAFATFILIWTIKRKSILGYKFSALTFSVTIIGAGTIILSHYLIKPSLMNAIYLFARIFILIFYFCPLNCR